VVASLGAVPARVTVVIPNWNGRELLGIVLPSLAAQEYRDFRTMVVDNGSTDGSLEYLSEQWPDVDVVALPANIGFAAAVNRGIEACDTDLVALLNNDIELDPRWLGELVAALDAHPPAGSACSKLIDYHDRSVLDGTGDLITWSGMCVRRGFGEIDTGQYDTPAEVFSACAGAAIYRREALDDVGLFDEEFFAYFEDVDWGFRSRLRGWRCRYVPTSVAYHMGGATTRRQGDRDIYFCRRNQVALVLKNFPGPSLLRYSWLLALDQAGALASALMERRVSRQLRSWRDALRQLPTTLRKRREVQARRTVGSDALDPLILGPRAMRGLIRAARARI
jgi:GT2 family glycosyltransferase